MDVEIVACHCQCVCDNVFSQRASRTDHDTLHLSVIPGVTKACVRLRVHVRSLSARRRNVTEERVWAQASVSAHHAAWLAHWLCDLVPVLQALTLVQGTVQHQPSPLTWTLAMTLTLAMTMALLGNATRGSCVGGTTATQHWPSQR